MAGIFPDGGTSSSNALGADTTITVDDLANCAGGPLFYPTNRCQPRFDPKSANYLISEAINLINASGIEYDCSRFDNLSIAVQKLANEAIFNCLVSEFPEISNACALEQIVLQSDASGCLRLARYSRSSAQIAFAANSSFWGFSYPGVAHPLTGQQTVGTHIYELTALSNAMAAGTVNASILNGPGNQNILGQMTFELECDTLVNIRYSQQMAFEPTQNSGNGAQSVTAILVDGNLIPTSNGNPLNFGLMSNFQASYSAEQRIIAPLSAGTHTLQFVLVAVGNNAARVIVTGNPTRTGGSWTAEVGFGT